MDDPIQQPKSRRGRALKTGLFFVVVLAGAVLLAMGISAYESRLAEAEAQKAADAAAAAAARASGGVQIAELQRAFEVMQLITMVLETKVTSSSVDESWRGDVKATVQSRARLLFGVDLASARIEQDTVAGLPRTTIHLAQPRKLASELVGTPAPGDTPGDDLPQVELGWLRFRTRAGEYHVGEARRLLPQAVAIMKLSNRDAEMVRQQTADRVRAMVRLFAGPDALVSVQFDEQNP